MSPNGFMTFEPRLRITFHEGNDNAEAQYETRSVSEEFVLTIVAMDHICVQHHVVSNRRYRPDNSARHGLLVLQCQCHLQAFLQ